LGSGKKAEEGEKTGLILAEGMGQKDVGQSHQKFSGGEKTWGEASTSRKVMNIMGRKMGNIMNERRNRLAGEGGVRRPTGKGGARRGDDTVQRGDICSRASVKADYSGLTKVIEKNVSGGKRNVALKHKNLGKRETLQRK